MTGAENLKQFNTLNLSLRKCFVKLVLLHCSWRGSHHHPQGELQDTSLSSSWQGSTLSLILKHAGSEDGGLRQKGQPCPPSYILTLL